MHNVVWNKDKQLSLTLFDKAKQSIDTKVIVSYEEISSSTNQEFNLSISPFEGNFIENSEYFLNVYKQKPSHEYVPVIRTEKLAYNSALAPWKQITIPVNTLNSNKDPNFDELNTEVSVFCISSFIDQNRTSGVQSVI